MPKYKIYTKIESNVPASNLFYDLTVYRMKNGKERYELLSVDKEPLGDNYLTQQHETNDTDDDLSVIYLMDIMLYRLHGGELHQALAAPSTKMFTLGEMVSGKTYSNNKRENVCYFETQAKTKSVKNGEGENVFSVNITCLERAFIAQEYSVGDPEDPFEKGKIKNKISSRINHSSYPNQGATSLCGPASFFYCLQMDRPDIYQKAANDLWAFGKTKINNLVIEPGKGCRHPKGKFYFNGRERVSGLDWITLASLRDSENSIMSYDEIDDQVAGITMWGKLSEWFEKAGYVKVFSNVGLSNSNVQDLAKLNEYANDGFKVVTLISAGMLFDFGPDDTSSKNHWIVWDGAIKNEKGQYVSESSKMDEIVNLKLFSWGEVKNQIKLDKSLGYVCSHIFGGMVFKPLK
ncbi:hypothetical protein [Pantoea sp. S18]|uniref:hypothetical protein n=1 Tax=Pantoea sp. S18 TaxID=3019892 RepID=UPI002B1FF7AC|nr:hypothetical protein [Pantoea sp. S18]MEA5103967.1 hypothetical protein [Pantoea sp. S18]